MTHNLENARCAWITPIFGVDGNLLYFKPILREFSRQCGDLRVFTSEFKGNESDSGLTIRRFGKLIRLYRVGRHSRNAQTRYLSGINMSLILPSGLADLVRWKPDILIVQEFSMLSCYALLAKLLLPKCKLLLVVECAPRTGGSWLMETTRLFYRRLIVKSADTLLTNNTLGAKYLTERLKVNGQNIVCKPYLVSDLTQNAGHLPRKPESREGMNQGQIRFLYVGQLFEQKGVHRALESFAMLGPEYLGRFRFDIVGDGPYRAVLERLATDAGLGKHVFFHGRRPYETLPAYYQSADAFVFPTLNDYRALVPFEALCFGLPILGSIHDGGVVETVKEGVNGFSFDPQEPRQLASILRRLLDNPEMLEPFSRESFEISRNYSLSSAVDALKSASYAAINA